jgi:hypothetical protein
MKIEFLNEKAELLLRNFIFEDKKSPFLKIENGDIKKTIDFCLRTISDSPEEEILLICGSFFIMRDCFQSLGVEIEVDEVEMNEI